MFELPDNVTKNKLTNLLASMKSCYHDSFRNCDGKQPVTNKKHQHGQTVITTPAGASNP